MMKPFPKFEHIDHTADVGLKIYGESLPQLFEHAALGLFDIIANLDKVGLSTERLVEVEATDREALLVSWLSELNYLFFTQREIYKRFHIDVITDDRIKARALGEQIDLDRHEIHTEVKAVTYHQLYIKEIHNGWEAQVIFDL